MRLIACPSCDRHVRVDDQICPFCGDANLPDLPTPTATRSLRGLGRAAIFAFGATVGVAASGCDNGTPAEDAGMVMPLYGGVPVDAGAGTDAGGEPDAGADAGEAVQPLYGGAPADNGGP